MRPRQNHRDRRAGSDGRGAQGASMQRSGGRRSRTAAAVALVLAGPLGTAQAQSVEELRGLSLEDLADVEITSVSRRPQPLSEAAAAVFVITSEDIRRSGAVSLPEVLRLAPNL